ncbi:ABC transporter permease [Plantibacter sp. Leaf171]|uniref:EamA family transporter n=1 Tax=unclassified Plantibacter TaxID=2624265 RepID=UPI0006FB14BA|nr:MULTISPECIES: EamA family transporter [unclassified Plantibacter]KQM16192.1 ABC transporter permease [Plantibacter sp. Leaf1]KQR59328.1 ABC transporter permease [Plantibacter sp. Leaf171]
MLSKNLRVAAITALAPVSWGTTYLVTSELLPPGRPLLAAVLRALPAGLLLLAITRTLPVGDWWWRSLVLGTLNIGAFFAFLFLAAYRLPGGVAATMGAIGPVLVAVLASLLVGEALTLRRVLAGLAGIGGVALIVLQADARLDVVGVVAALAGAVSMSLGSVLSKRWGRPSTGRRLGGRRTGSASTASGLAVTAWQLVAGGLVLVPVLLVVEGLPADAPGPAAVGGYAYLAVVGTALAYALWFRGIGVLPVGSVSFLGLLSPVVAVLLGVAVLGEGLSLGQLLGIGVVAGSLVLVFTARAPKTILSA